MTIRTEYMFDTGSGFVYDSAKVEFTGALARLKLVTTPGQLFTPTISDSTYDSDELEYAGGMLRQKDQRPTGSTFYAAWASSLNGNWGNGTLTGTAFNGAAISGGYLDLRSNVTPDRYAEFAATGNAASLATGAVKFKLTPNYSGTPGAYQIFWTVFTTNGVAPNAVEIYHATGTGSLVVRIFDSGGVAIVNQDLGLWNPTAGTEYEIEVDWDITVGATRVFVNGVQMGTTATGTGTRTAPTLMRIGAEYVVAPGVVSANFRIRELIVFDAVQHTTNYTPGYSYSPTIYLDAVANLPLFTFGGVGAVTDFSAFSGTDAGVPHYTLGGKYWNGSAWVVSNGSYAQSNTLATVVTNIPTLAASDTLQINAIYQAGATQGSITTVTLTYSYEAYPVDNPTITPNAPLSVDDLLSFTSTFAQTGADEVHFLVKVGSDFMYWTGSAWAISDGTFAQSNTADEINDNADALDLSEGVYFTIAVFLHSDDGSSTPDITDMVTVTDYFGPQPTGPNVCTIVGYIYDEAKVPVNRAIVSIIQETTFNNQGVVQAPGTYSATSNAQGYFELTLAETETVEKKQFWKVVYPGPTKAVGTKVFGYAIVPNSPTVDIVDVTFTEEP